MSRLLHRSSRLFDRLDGWWGTVATRKRVASLLIAVFLAGLAVIELKRRGLLPETIAGGVPNKHYFAILIALLLLFSLVLLGVDYVRATVTGTPAHGFFEVFYTLLIFADVLIVLISLRYNISYPVVFRYFGFAVATVMIRLALTAPRIADAALGVAATLFAIGLTRAYNRAATALWSATE